MYHTSILETTTAANYNKVIILCILLLHKNKVHWLLAFKKIVLAVEKNYYNNKP